MKKIAFVIMGVLMALLLFSPTMVKSHPPRHCKGLDIYFYETPDMGFAAILAGEIDFMQWSLTYEQYMDACATPDLQLAGFAENGMMEFDLNNNYTIAKYPGIRSPMNDVNFRRALAHATDKDYFVEEVIKGFAMRIDPPLCAPQYGYANESTIDENYPYYYDTDKANEVLDDAGFDDWDGDGWRNYPLDWDGVEGEIGVRDEPNLCEIDLCIRMMHAHRNAAGTHLGENMKNVLHIPTFFHYGTSDDLFPIVMDDFNYHIYTGGWSFGRYPIYIYSLFHSDNYFSGASNYVSGYNKSGLPNYPDLDEALYDVYYATTMENFAAAVKRATGLHVIKYCVNIPLWSYSSWWAYSKYIVGIVNQDGGGLENTYTFLNAYKVDNPATGVDESQEPIKMGTIHAPKDLNILYSTWYYDYAVLDRCVSGGLISVNPYALSIDQPWIAQDWEVTMWYDPQDDEEKTKVTYWIRKDVMWHAPVTGAEVRQFTAHDVEFSIWYIYPITDCWNWMSKDVHHTNIIDDFTIEVYFDSISIFHVYATTWPMLPKYEYLDLLCKEECCEFVATEERNPSDTDILCPPCGSIIQIINATLYPAAGGTVNLIEGTDYEIFGTALPDYCHNEIHWLRSLAIDDSVVFCYWTGDLDPDGYYLAGLDWSETFYSLGPYYVTGIKEGVGGWAIMNCNPSFFLETPPLGEIDWMWYWDGTTKPRSGYYQINLYDAVTLLKAYGTRGDTCPVPPNWCPGADLDAFDLCHIGLYDACQLLTIYGTKFGIPP